MKNAKGGYQIVTLLNRDLSGAIEGTTIDGIYKTLEGNYKKPILLEGLVEDGIEKDAKFVNVHLEDTTYILEDVYGNDVLVYEDDTVDIRKSINGYIKLDITGLTLQGDEIVENKLYEAFISLSDDFNYTNAIVKLLSDDDVTEYWIPAEVHLENQGNSINFFLTNTLESYKLAGIYVK